MSSFIPPILQSESLLEIWHTYRIAILTCVGIILFSIRIALKYFDEPLSSPSSPQLPSTVASRDVKDDSLDPKSSSIERRTHVDPVTSLRRPDVTSRKSSNGPRRVVGVKKDRRTSPESDATSFNIQPVIFFSSLGGATEFHSRQLLKDFEAWRLSGDQPRVLEPQILDLSYIELDDYFISPPPASPNTRYFYLILLPTYNIDSTLDIFIEHLQETHNDFRIDTAPLQNLSGYSVFGFGDREGWPTEEEGLCSQARDVDKWMAKLTARKRAFPLGMGDVKSDARTRLEEWRFGVQDALQDILANGGLGEGVEGSGEAVESGDEEIEDDDDPSVAVARSKKRKQEGQDLEDIASSVPNPQSDDTLIPVDFTTYSAIAKSPLPQSIPKEMVPQSSPTHKALTKQGYTIVGSHSGVKICRWTKSALRGRGSCYKYSFYGIKSHLCMETTPSLSCSNKCVFCWRHGTNPVGTTWRWQVDPPEMIFDGVKEGHYKKIKMLKGVPGVRAERFQEAMRIRHCALSLVGEPIFYPYINEFTGMLHKEHISSFLVCNAQHPDQLATLQHVTQLYVSIDASNKESLKKIDRPLHRDFWERFQRCLDILREKRFMQRTVFRLTLVKGFNIDDEVEGYADLVGRGLPCFVEVKGVTFCGTSTSSSAGLTMQNVPFYEEVATFVLALNKALQKRGLDYGIAAEHAHSCCVVLASTRFRINGKWHTRIGYDKFFKCLESGQEFGPEDYIDDEPTPEWAMWGRGGFDPRDQRVDRKGNAKDVELIDYDGLANALEERQA